MSTVMVVAKILAKQEKIELVKTELLKLIEPTRKDDGCIKYNLLQNNDAPELFFFCEEWRDEDALEKHLKTEHINNYLKATEGCVEEFVVNKNTLIS
ncbi:MAG: putative quinol monooxygenase [Alphaproteobacteria bacterium]